MLLFCGTSHGAWVGMQCVIELISGHTHLFFFINGSVTLNWVPCEYLFSFSFDLKHFGGARFDDVADLLLAGQQDNAENPVKSVLLDRTLQNMCGI